MSYLLDVNVLLAMYYAKHMHHLRVSLWLKLVRSRYPGRLRFSTCSITELGFVRVATSTAAAFAPNVAAAQEDLRQLTSGGEFSFIGDEVRALRLPRWTRKSAQTTDGHLVELAAEYGLTVLTLDEGIPGAELVPLIAPPLRVEEGSAGLETTSHSEPRLGSTGLWLE